MARKSPTQIPPNDVNLDTAELVDRYEAGAARIREAVMGADDESLRRRPAPEQWSCHDILCHLADCDQFLADRMKRTLADDKPLLLGAPTHLYPEPLHYAERVVEEELVLIAATRAQMARILRLVSREAWDRPAVHSENGLITLRQIVLHAVHHTDVHVARMHTNLAADAR
jgi:uncharacterized damage-inducible protein DinB